MALSLQASFSSGELDPVLHERTNLQKYQSGLATARNIVIGRSGRIVSRGGRKVFVKTKLDNRRVLIHTLEEHNTFLEWGHEYVRIYWSFTNTSSMQEHAHTWTESDLDNIHFVNDNNKGVYVFCKGKTPLYLWTIPGLDGFRTGIFDIPAAPTLVGSVTVGGTGYDVDYAITAVVGGQESLVLTVNSGKIPLNVSEKNSITADLASSTSVVTEMRVYRRPRNAGAFGYIGSSSAITTVSSQKRATFDDVGQAADYTNSPPTLNSVIQGRGATGPGTPTTGVFYQQRLLVNDSGDGGFGILTSRTGYANNFYRDYPLSSDSSLAFKAGSSGAEILRMIDSDGLAVFTRAGVFLNTGVLSPTNLILVKKGKWVIDKRIPPIAIPGGVLFVDSATNAIRLLAWSDELASYSGEELSIFSNHLFTGKRIRSWAFEEGDVPVLWVVLNDGTCVSFTFERDQQMRAWTRHDSTVAIEYVASTTTGTDQNSSAQRSPQIIFVTEKNGSRYIELGISRYASIETQESDPEWDKGEWNAAMDSIKSFKTLISGTITVTPVTTDEWGEALILDSGTAGLFPSPGAGAIGQVLRYFNPDDGTQVDLEVTARTSDNVITVMPSCDFPSDKATNPRLYLTATTFSGLDHLEGENVSVIADGYVVASPNNDIENYPTVTVTSGAITLPGGLRGAIVHVGRPITYDWETLDIDSVEQRPVLIESKTLNKVYVKVYKSSGLYIGNKFPTNDKVNGMEAIDSYEIDYENDTEILGNRYQASTTRRIEVTLPGDWRSQGRICGRQVDPLHFEVLSVIPDLEDLRR